ncbi:MAG: methyl-accepting chemotaxis protein [Betaproteobacteria bacterium]|nr:methyl-accepting chemotaxis protein [Betaproteobacteria bacterium]
MLSAIRRRPLAQQTLLGVVLICVFAAAGLSVTLSSHTRQVALDESRSTLRTQTDLIARTLEYAEENMKRDAVTAEEQFESRLPPARLTGQKVPIGGTALPELMFGNAINGVGNQKFILDYKKTNPLNDPAFLIKNGDKLFRGTTLLKSADGQYRDGELVSDSYAQTVLSGKRHIGTIQRSGKIYALAVNPLKDEHGQTIAAISMRVDVGQNVATLKEKLSSITIGKSGYPYIIAEGSGDNKEPYFVMHPTLQGKPISAVGEELQSSLKTILKEKEGFLSHSWITADGKSQQDISVFQEIPALQWIVVASAPEEEFTAPFDNIRHLLLIGLMATVVLLVLCLALLVRAQLRPLDRVAEGVAQIGQGNLSYHVETHPNSRNEIDLLGAHVNETRDEMRTLVGAIRGSADKVASSASDVFESMQQLSVGIDGLSSSSFEISNSIANLSTSINHIAGTSNAAHGYVGDAVAKVKHGKQVVDDVIDSIRVIENRVQSSLSEVKTLSDHSQQIEKVVTTISAIAGQTNLLALNAAIEAARAGEVGRSFAVVADEVRKLAEQSAQSANEIGEILGHVTSGVTAVQASIAEVVVETRKTTESSGAAGAALEEIENITHSIADAVTSIADATQRQSEAAQSEVQQITASAQAIEKTEAVTRNVSQNAADLKEEAEKLARQAGHFVI